MVYDSRECFTVPITETSTLFSIEGVYAVIEVKSSPSKNASIAKVIREAVSNIESIYKCNSPIPFSMTSEIPAFISLSAPFVLKRQGSFFVKVMRPVSAIILLGTGTKLPTIVKHFRQAQESVQHWHDRPDMLCVIDENEYGLCGTDFVVGNDHQVISRFWVESCDSPGQALATFLYWLVHKMTFERVIEQPIFCNKDVQAVWPSVIAPVVRRIEVHTSESGHEKSWPWPNETRVFET